MSITILFVILTSSLLLYNFVLVVYTHCRTFYHVGFYEIWVVLVRYLMVMSFLTYLSTVNLSLLFSEVLTELNLVLKLQLTIGAEGVTRRGTKV